MTPTQPRTQAGKALNDDLGFHAFLDGSYAEDRIVAIEEEARLGELQRLVKLMKDGGLPGATDQEKAGIQYAAIYIAGDIARIVKP